MTATDELRKLLDERGIEHEDRSESYKDNWKPTNWTRWRCADGKYATYHHCEQLDLKRLVKYGCTPEQAIAATLGSGECKLRDCEGSFSAVNRPVWLCDCGAFVTQYTDATTYHKPRFCPNCGRSVKR